jgi:hypothetical protein
VSDALAAGVADPFMVHADGTWYMFFEVIRWEWRQKRGVIGLATSRDGLRWAYQRIVLEEPFHLSYPYVFKSASDYYMIPESKQAGLVRLYLADPFPDRWVFVANLLSGPALRDSSLLRWDERWWLFVETDPLPRNDTLRLFHARELTGPWQEHPRSPIVTGDPRIARPAGRVLTDPDRPIRFAQDCCGEYGTRVHALAIEELTERDYRETELEGGPVVAGSGRGWNRSGMHHVDAHECVDGRWLACVDGWASVRGPRNLMRWRPTS